jgi:hypothetical protein
MPVRPKIKSYGDSFGTYGGDGLNDYSVKPDNIDPSKLGNNRINDGFELNRFEESIRDFILARLGHPVVRVELTDFQIKTAIDEAVSHMSHHAPLWTRQIAAFQTEARENLYELPPYMIQNLQYVVYKKTLLSIAAQSGTLEFDFFIKYFQENHLLNDFSVGEFLLLQQNLEQMRKVLSQEGSWDVINNKYIQVYPTPVSDEQVVILEYRALDTNTIHPAYRNWIQRYSLAVGKEILGQTRGKYAVLPGPGGGSQLNGDKLVEQAAREKEALIAELLTEIEEPPVFTLY